MICIRNVSIPCGVFLPYFQLCTDVCAGPGRVLAGAEKLALTTALAGFVVLGSQVHSVLTWGVWVGEEGGGGAGLRTHVIGIAE